MKKSTRTLALSVAALGALALGVTACDGGATTAQPPSAQSDELVGAKASGTAKVEQHAAPAPAPAAPVANPLTDDGTWLVPADLAPGTYRVMPTSTYGGYVEVCADLGCEIDFDGDDATGLIDNYNVEGPTYVVVPPTAAAVTWHDVSAELIAP